MPRQLAPRADTARVGPTPLKILPIPETRIE
jgi:hypothetical protein